MEKKSTEFLLAHHHPYPATSTRIIQILCKKALHQIHTNLHQLVKNSQCYAVGILGHIFSEVSLRVKTSYHGSFPVCRSMDGCTGTPANGACRVFRWKLCQQKKHLVVGAARNLVVEATKGIKVAEIILFVHVYETTDGERFLRHPRSE